MTSKKPRIAILFPVFLGGGAESVCAWMLQALKDKYHVRLLTFSTLDISTLNQLYDTHLSPEDVEVVVPPFRKWIPERLVHGYSSFTLRQHLLICYLKGLKETHDIVISAFNEIDAGQRAIQYIHFPMVGPGHEAARQIVGYPDSPVRRFYRKMCQRVSRFSKNQMQANLTLANSNWTAGVIKQIYNLEVKVIYPPVVSAALDVPWEEREGGFVLVSRTVPEKKIERAIRILAKVRSHGYAVHLHIIGGGDKRYQRDLMTLDSDPSWILWHGQVDRATFNSLLQRHKYGIHTRENEHFGIGVAEMLNAGCIPFVPASGGQVEIVGSSEWLTFAHEDEAVDKIVRVLSSAKSQQELRHSLVARGQLFSTERFESEIREVVSGFLGVRT